MYPITVRYLRPLFEDERGNSILTPLVDVLPELVAAALSLPEDPLMAEDFWVETQRYALNQEIKVEFHLTVLAPLHPRRLADLTGLQKKLEDSMTDFWAGFLIYEVDCAVTVLLCPAATTRFTMKPDLSLSE